MPKLKISDLNKLYQDSDLCDSEIFAEQRGNIRLVNGDHFTKKNKFYWNRFKDTTNIAAEQKVRITQNHVHNISKTYTNSILSLAQDAVILPKNESELQDQKCAELNSSVWEDIKQNNDWDNRKEQFASDFVDIGEVVAKVYWNKDAGKIVGYAPTLDEFGQPIIDPTGQYVQSNNPIRSGKVEVKRIFAFNLLREKGSKSKDESRYLIERYMADVAEVKRWVAGDEEKLRAVQKSADETYKVFNGASGEYEDSKEQVMVREYYYKPSGEYPNGYYYITTPYGVLFEGELPFGIFPIVWSGFDDIQTSARSRSIFKQIRSFQAEINRAVSTIVEIQLSNGFDKVFIQGGAKISPAQYLPGVRAYSVSGIPPTVVEGRTGDQYLNYINFQINEMYRVAKIEEVALDKAISMDPYAMLFMDARQKKAFSMYASKFGRFLNDICKLAIEIARHYYDEKMLIPVVGKREQVNIPEFLTTDALGYKIKIIEGSDDVGSQIGKQLAMNQVLQYAAGSLSKENIGKIIRNMPYLNKEDAFEDLTIDYDEAKNIVLSLDRGEFPTVEKSDTAPYIIKKLTLRMRQADFRYLDPQIQANYKEYKMLQEQMEVQKQKEIQMAQSGFIPATGPLVNVEFYINTPDGKTQRAKLPSDAVRWLIEKINSQGSYYETIKDMNPGDLSDMAQMHNQSPQGSGQMNPMVSPQGSGMPGNLGV